MFWGNIEKKLKDSSDHCDLDMKEMFVSDELFSLEFTGRKISKVVNLLHKVSH
jgi:hypothetical protein